MTKTKALEALTDYEKTGELGRIDAENGKWILRDLFTYVIIKR